MHKTLFFSWSDLLELLELKFPKAYDFFYHFHSSNGLEERDMYPSERLSDICVHSESNYQLLLRDFGASAFPDLTDVQLGELEHEITPKGIAFTI